MTAFDVTDAVFADVDPRTVASLFAVSGDIALVMDSVGVIRDVALGAAEGQFDSASQWVGRPWIDTVTSDTRAKIDTLMK